MAVTRLVLVRHGEAQAYLDQVVAGEKGCTGLSDLGRRQAAALRERLARTGELADTAALYASILPRAIETASIIAPVVGGHEIEQDCDFCELHPGEADGMLWTEYREKYWKEPWDPNTVMSPGGESFTGFVDRVDGALRRLVERHPDDTLVIGCHGGVVMSSMFAALGVPIGDRKFLNGPENTSITEWHIEGDHWGLVRYNDHAHLADLSG